MSHLPGNPHAEDHEQMYHYIGDTVVAEIGQTDATLIWSAIENHAQATLALAYEQRTANMLKVLELQGRMHDVQQTFNLSASDVAERLGMRAEK